MHIPVPHVSHVPHRFLRVVALATVAAGLASLPAAEASSPFTTWRASVGTAGGDANGRSLDPWISVDGRFVVFQSGATDLVPDDKNFARDIFLRHIPGGPTTRASVSMAGGDPVLRSSYPEVDRDGGFVVFMTDADNVVPNDNDTAYDIVVRDVAAQANIRVSVDRNGGNPDAASSYPAISADGRWVVFLSYASDLVAGDHNGARDVFLKDLTTNAPIRRLSLSTAGGDPDADSYLPAISADGRYVTYASEAANLVPNDHSGGDDVFLTDTVTGTTVRISTAVGGGDPDGESGQPAISADGRYVAFESEASNLVPNDGNHHDDVFVYDRVTGSTRRASVSAAGADPGGDSLLPSIDGDGRYVAFQSYASNLVSGDTNNVGDVFVRDMVANTTTRVSVPTGGGQANGESGIPSIDGDGSVVAYQSYASNLTSNDHNGLQDVFATRWK